MAKGDRILVVVDPTAAVQPAVDRAAQVAAGMGWALELLVCIHDGMPARVPKAADGAAVRRRLLEHQLGYLKDLASRKASLDIATKAVWDRPLHEAIIRETLRIEPRLVMKDSHYHSAVSRALVTNTDWHLIRDCPAPLWLVRGAPWPEHPTVLAMVDPTHQHDQPADLDHRLLEETTVLADGLGGEAHAVHCFDPVPLTNVVGVLGAAGIPGQVAQEAVQLQAEHASRLQEIAVRHRIQASRAHLRQGPPATAIPEAVRELNGDLAVMGAVSRSGLERLFLGNTAERVLDRLSCDVLVLKPRRFESPVTYRPQASDFMELN